MRVSYTSTVVCGYSSLPRYALSYICSRRRQYLFRSALFNKQMSRKFSFAFFLSLLVETSPSINSKYSMMYSKLLLQTSSRFCTFDLKRFRNELFDSVSPFLILKEYISASCNMNCLLSLLSILSVIFFTVFRRHIKFKYSSYC